MTTCVTNEPKATVRASKERYDVPRVDIHETKEAYVLEADMPGVKKEGLEILMEGDELTLVGHRETGNGQGDTLYRESYDGSFRRTFELDPRIDRAGVAARLTGGVLTVTLPKAAELKPRQIKVAG